MTTITTTNCHPAARTHRRRLVPVRAGWALDAAARLDEARPGFLRHLIGTKPRERQAVFTAFDHGALQDPIGFVEAATGRTPEPGDALAEAADLLLELSPKAVIEASVGLVPDGLLGALDRAGENPLARGDYRKLMDLLAGSGPDSRARRLALRYCRDIASPRLAVIERLHPSLLHVNLMPKVRCADHADFANTIVATVLEYSSTATPASIAQAVSDTKGRFTLSSFLTELLMKNVDRLPAPPFETPAVLRPLRTPEDFRETGARFRNCLATKAFSHALIGRAAFYDFQGKAIAVVIRTQDAWVLGRVHMERNGMPDPEIVGEVRAAFAASGVRCLLPYVPQGRMAAVAELFDPLGATAFLMDADEWAEDG
jgi:hypothetical protein